MPASKPISRETDSFRIWKPQSKKHAREMVRVAQPGLAISLNGKAVQLCGFREIKGKISGDVIFAFKLKAEAGQILYWAKDEQDSEVCELLELFKSNPFGCELVSCAEALNDLDDAIAALE